VQLDLCFVLRGQHDSEHAWGIRKARRGPAHHKRHLGLVISHFRLAYQYMAKAYPVPG
jgi:hypothetical protein